MNLRTQVAWRLVIVYILAVPLLSLCIEVSWGIVHGLLSGYSLKTDSTFSDELTKFLNKKGIVLNTHAQGDVRALVRNKLSDQDRSELERIIRKYQVVTFGSAFLASALAFGLIGFLAAILTSSWMFVGLLPLASFALNNPITRYAIIADITFGEKLFMISLAQFGASYLFAYLGAKLRVRRVETHLAAS